MNNRLKSAVTDHSRKLLDHTTDNGEPPVSDTASLFRGKRVTVMGLGLLGRGLGDTLFLIRCGAHVTVTDLKTEDQLAPSLKELAGLPVRLRLGRHDPADFAEADMILRNADVPRSSPFLKQARERGVPVEMDESLFCKHFQGMVIGITGTRGKTTTSTLIHRILSLHRSRVFLAGNIMGKATLPLLEDARPDDAVVLELSSWQLQGFHDAGISPHASVFTNVYPDHLNRYRDMTEYIDDKKAVFLYQKAADFCVFNGDQPETTALSEEAPAGKAFFSKADVPDHWKILLPGVHNRENIAGAVCLCTRLGVPEQTIRRAVEGFTGVEHRLQWLGEKNGIGFVNDSTSTTPVAGCAALDAFQGKRIFLIAGGADKKLDLMPFARAAADRAEKIALLNGSATESLRRGIEQAGAKTKLLGPFDDLKSAVERLMEHTVAGDTVLLSPGCASFGMFQNEFHRGETFINIVKDIGRR
ncbi:MAG: UDP-N-acetylmuramoyl-L-alanine--D-glutamate ligase [Pseudomonadota bacterium]